MIDEKIEKKAPTLYDSFNLCSVKELEIYLKNAKTREEKAFYRTLLNLRLKLDQEKIVGKNFV